MEQATTPERRICKRRILYTPEYLDMGAENGGVVLNLSEGGLGFQAVGRVEPGSEIPLSFSLGHGYRVAVKARVVWVDAQGKSGGAAFGRLSKDSHSLIREWLATPEFEHEEEEGAPAPVAESGAPLDIAPVPAEPAAVAAFETVATPVAPSNNAPVPNASAATPPNAAAILTAPARDVAPATAAPRPQSVPVMPMRPQAVPPITPKFSEGEREGPRGDSFSPVPSLSVWGRNDAPARPSVPQPKGNGPLFPPRNAENIFARTTTEIEPERNLRRGSALFIISIVIAAGAILTFYVRGHRQQVGEAIARIGNAVAGAPASTALTSAIAADTVSTGGSTAATGPATSTPSESAGQAPQVPATPGQVTKSQTTPAASAVEPVAKAPVGGAAQANTPQSSASSRQPATLRVGSQGSGPFVPKAAKTASASAQAPANPYGGQAEYQRAENYLNGNGVTQDYVEAADWFWRSLEAGNTNAAIPLANLYLEGNGVSRSCTQARILLDAAAQKNITEAIQKLAQLPENCQ
jgi:localization factor PodJL